MNKRKTIGKKMRFEVFKRDSFQCQYCGKTSPDVVLEVDHIKPVSAGGNNGIMNLITSCFDCNRGKGKTLLDDNSVIEKQKKQLEELNEKRNQLEMMMKWREGLQNLEDDKIKILISRWEELVSCTLRENGISDIKKMNKKFEMNLILDCMDIAVSQYCEHDIEEGGYTIDSIEKAFKYVPRICNNKQKEKDEPYLKDLYYISGILNNRLRYYEKSKGIKLLKDAYLHGASIDSLKELATTVKHWTSFKNAIEDFLDE